MVAGKLYNASDPELVAAYRNARRFCRAFNATRPEELEERGRMARKLFAEADLWPQLFSDVSCIALWISSEKILTRLYSVLHWFHKRLEANVKKPRENRCFQTVIVFSFSSFDNSNKCTVLLKIAARLITVSTSVNKEMWVKLSSSAVVNPFVAPTASSRIGPSKGTSGS